MVENIWIAASDNDIEAVKQFLENGVDVNTADENGYTPMYAIHSLSLPPRVMLLMWPAVPPP